MAQQAAGVDQSRLAELLEEAVALDPGFVSAWRGLGMVYTNLGADRGRVARAMTAAYELRDRLPERERYLAEASYHHTLSGDRRRAIQAYRQVLAVEPGNGTAMNNLGLMLVHVGELADAEAVYRRGVDLDDAHIFTHRGLARTRYRQGRVAEAMATLDSATAVFGRNPVTDEDRLHMWAVEHRWTEVDALAAEMLSRYADNREARRNAMDTWVEALRAQGRLREAEALGAELLAVNRELGALGRIVEIRASEAELSLWVRGDPDRARREVEEILADPAVEAVAPAARPMPRLAAVLATTGDAPRAAALLADWEALPADERGPGSPWRQIAHSRIALATGRPEAAIAAIRRALEEDPVWAFVFAPAELARAWEAAGRPDSARTAYERYLATPDPERIHGDAIHLASSLVRLAELYEEVGDVARAAETYNRFVELWRNADPELRPRVEAVERRLRVLVAESG